MTEVELQLMKLKRETDTEIAAMKTAFRRLKSQVEDLEREVGYLRRHR